MRTSRRTRSLLRLGVAITLAFIYIPLIVIGIYAFNEGITLEWPPESLSTKWFGEAIDNQGVRDAMVNSLEVGAIATAIALVLGTLASLAVARHRFFGRETVSFLVVIPIALPGIVTGLALSNTFTQVFGMSLSLFTVVVAHATFCIVVVYNNVIARLRRMSGSIEEASADLGAGPWRTFRHVTLPSMRTALVAGGLLAFALSFDEIIVTNFTSGSEITLPKWIFNNLRLPNARPQVNVVAFAVVASPSYAAGSITINGNAGFTTCGCATGSGTAGNPYVIGPLAITSPNSSGSAITIENTTANFTVTGISANYNDSNPADPVIHLMNVTGPANVSNVTANADGTSYVIRLP